MFDGFVVSVPKRARLLPPIRFIRSSRSATFEAPLPAERVAQLSGAFGCAAEIEVISETVLARSALPDDEHEAVRLTVDYLVNHDDAWRGMVRGVVPPSVRDQALSVVVRSRPTAPADMIAARVFATVRDLLRLPG